MVETSKNNFNGWRFKQKKKQKKNETNNLTTTTTTTNEITKWKIKAKIMKIP